MSGYGAGTRKRGAFAELRDALGDLVEQVVGFTPSLGGQRFPRYELRIEDDGFRVVADLPATRRADIDVTVAGRTLTISGERQRPELPEGANVLRRERRFGRFERSIELPEEVDPVDVVARLSDGVLEVWLPKPKSRQRRVIPVEKPEAGCEPRGEAEAADEGAPSGQPEDGRSGADDETGDRPEEGSGAPDIEVS